MKYIIAAFCVFMVIEAVVAPPPKPSRRPKPTRCGSGEDCGADECCVDRGMSLFRKGVCMRLAPEGRPCNLKEENLRGKYLWHCPCAEGLDCVAEKTVKVPWDDELRVNERCVSPTASSAQPEPDTDAPETEAPEPETEAPAEE